LVVILCVAAALRLAGLTWGLPGTTHLFSYHPDEYFALRAALFLAAGDPNPHFFNYPSLYLYLVAAAGSLAGHVPALGSAQAAQVPLLLRALTVDARLVTVVLSLGTILTVYGAAARIAGGPAGLFAAAALAVLPGHVLNSHWATVDVPLAFLVTLSLYLATRLLDDEGPKAAALAGLAAGAAMATKYHGALAAVMPLAGLVVRVAATRTPAAAKPAAVQALVVLVAMALAFVVLSPYVLIDWPSAQRDIAFETRHMREGEYPAQVIDPNGWLFHLRALGCGTGGSAVLAAYLVLFGYGVWRTRAASAPLAVFCVVWFAAIGAAGVRYARYGVPLLPLMAIGAGAGLAGLLGRRPRLRASSAMSGAPTPIGRDEARPHRRAWSGTFVIGVMALVAVVLLPLASSVLLCSSVASEEDARDTALRDIRKMVPPGARVGIVRSVWFDLPPVDYDNGGVLGDNPPWAQFHRSPYQLVETGMDAATLEAERPQWFVESDFQLADLLRANDHRAVGFQQALERRYEVQRSFSRGRSGLLLWGSCGPEPHEWRYLFLGIRLWRLREAEDSHRSRRNR
jgi:hypothetical protein